jgi:predicted RND superfamily exporter protein
MNEEEPLKQRYLLRFKIGVGLLILLAFPAIFHSHAAIESLFNRPADWVPDSLPVKSEFNQFVRYFTANDLAMLGWESSDVDSESLDRAAQLLRPLCESTVDLSSEKESLGQLPGWVGTEIDEIRATCNLTTPFQWVRTGTDTLTQMTSPPANISRPASIRRLQGSLVGPDGEQTCLIVSFSERGSVHRRYLVPKLREIVGRINGLSADQIAVVGGPFEGATVDEASIRSIRIFTPPSAILAAVLCLICLRSLPLTAAIVAVAVIGEGLVLAAVYYTGTPMNAILIVLPPLIFVLTVSSGIHLSNYYLDAAREFPELTQAQAAQRAMQAGVAPCVLAAGTTVVGLSSLMLVRLEPVRIFGGVASLGVTVTLSLIFLIMPGAMVLTRVRRPAVADDGDSTNRGFLGTWMRRRLASPWPLITVFLLISVGLSLGLTRLQTSVNVPRMFLPDSDIRRQYAWFEEHIGPTIAGDVLLAFPPLSEQDDPLDRLELVRDVHLRALEQTSVAGVLSPMTFVPSIPRDRSFGATARRSVIKQLIRDPQSSLGRLGFIARDDQSEVWRISVRMPQQDQGDFRDEILSIRRAVEDEVAASDLPAEVTFTGQVAIVQESQDILLRDLFRSFMTAFGIIAVVMMVMLRSVIGGLIAMLPNLFPTIVLFGAMGLFSLPLDIGSVMSASVALGIAVDDTVHLLSRYGSRRARGLGQIRAAYGALSQCFWAMFQTTLVCGLSLMVYWFSDFVPTSQFSLFMFGLLSAALLGVVFLLPTLMSTPLGSWLSRPIGANAKATLYADHHDGDPPPDVRRLPARQPSEWDRHPTRGSDQMK